MQRYIEEKLRPIVLTKDRIKDESRQGFTAVGGS